MISDKTKETLKKISETCVAVDDVVVDTTKAILPWVPGASVVPIDVLNGIVKTALKSLPEIYEKAADALGLNEHITINIEEPDTDVTGTIHF